MWVFLHLWNEEKTHHPEPEILKEESKRLLLFGKDVLFADGKFSVVNE